MKSLISLQIMKKSPINENSDHPTFIFQHQQCVLLYAKVWTFRGYATQRSLNYKLNVALEKVPRIYHGRQYYLNSLSLKCCFYYTLSLNFFLSSIRLSYCKCRLSYFYRPLVTNSSPPPTPISPSLITRLRTLLVYGPTILTFTIDHVACTNQINVRSCNIWIPYAKGIRVQSETWKYYNLITQIRSPK